MQLNHANMAVPDVPAAADFFSRHFGFKTLSNRNDAFVVMVDEAGFTFNLMLGGKGDPPAYPKNFHLGFFVGNVETVHVKHAELLAAGFTPGKVQEFSRGGETTTTFYIEAPGGFLVEVAHSA